MRRASKVLVCFSLVIGLSPVGSSEVRASNPATQIKKAAAHSSLGVRLLNKVAQWGTIVLLSAAATTGNVAAQNKEATQTAPRVRQSRFNGVVGHHRVLPTIPLHEVLKGIDYDSPEEIDYGWIEGMLASGEMDVNARNEESNTALHIVAKEHFYTDNYEDFKLTKILLAYGADPTLKNYERKTALDYALDSSFCCVDRTAVEMARLLVAKGADVHEVDYRDRAARGLALHNALEAAAVLVTDRHKFINLLEKEEGGITRSVRDKGKHLLKQAAEWGNAVVVEALLDYGVDPNVGLFGVALSRQRTMARQTVMSILIARGADINVRDAQRGNTPLHRAVGEGNLRSVETLLEGRAHPNIADKSGQTPLHRAAAYGGTMTRFELVGMLLASDAEVNIKDNYGHTPYDYAVENYKLAVGIRAPAAAAAAAILLQTMVEDEDAQGRTPAYWAKLSGSETIKKISAGEMEIDQLHDRTTRQLVVEELLRAIGNRWWKKR